jgi:hypothetical protein
MSTANGYNPVRWKCEESGCNLVYAKFHIEDFYDCFPRAISMGDADGFVELNHHFLFIEHKSGEPREPAAGEMGQFMALQRMTKVCNRFTVVYVFGNPCTREFTHWRSIKNGIVGDWVETDFTRFKKRVGAWAKSVSIRSLETAVA